MLLMIPLLKKIKEAKKYTKTYHVGMLQTHAFRTLKQHTSIILKEFRITPLDWAILGTLSEQKKNTSQKKLAKLLNIQAPLITRRSKRSTIQNGLAFRKRQKSCAAD